MITDTCTDHNRPPTTQPPVSLLYATASTWYRVRNPGTCPTGAGTGSTGTTVPVPICAQPRFAALEPLGAPPPALLWRFFPPSADFEAEEAPAADAAGGLGPWTIALSIAHANFQLPATTFRDVATRAHVTVPSIVGCRIGVCFTA